MYTSTPALQTNTQLCHVSLSPLTQTGFPHLSGYSLSHPPQTEWCHRRAPHREGSPPTRGSDAGCWWRCHCCFWCPGDRTVSRGEMERLQMRQIQHYTEVCRTNVLDEREQWLKRGRTLHRSTSSLLQYRLWHIFRAVAKPKNYNLTR